MIVCRLLQRLSEHIAFAVGLGGSKLFEGGEEVIMSSFPVGPEVLHRECGDQRVIERTILPDRAGGDEIGPTWPFFKRQFVLIDAQPIRDRPADKAFRVNRPGEVVVQIGAFGEGQQKSLKLGRIAADPIEIACSRRGWVGWGSGTGR